LKIRIFFLSLIAILQGCATTSSYCAVPHEESDDAVTLVIYRPDASYGLLYSTPMSIDNCRIRNLSNNSYLIYKLPAGHHRIAAEKRALEVGGDGVIEGNFKAGNTYFLHYAIRPDTYYVSSSYFTTSTDFFLVSQEQALQIMPKLGNKFSGGTIGGLIPAPKHTKGTITDNTYTSKDGDFSISIPHKEGSNEYSHMNIKEQYYELGTYISFGPAAVDQSIYRLEIGKKLTPDSSYVIFDDAVNAVIESYSQQLESSYKSKPKLLSKEKTTINSTPSYKIVLQQTVNGQVLNHDVFVADYDSVAAIFWVQTFSQGIKKASLEPLLFAESFKILK